MSESAVTRVVMKRTLFVLTHGSKAKNSGGGDRGFSVDDQTLYTWCAWDSLFIPEILGHTARVESACPVTQARISLTVGPQRIIEAEPSGVVISMVTYETG